MYRLNEDDLVPIITLEMEGSHLMEPYQCPLCGQKMERDLVIFRDHTNGHIFDAIKKKFPEWIEDDGGCRKCIEFYESQLRP